MKHSSAGRFASGRRKQKQASLGDGFAVGSKYSSGPAVISKQATKAFSAADVLASRKRSWGGEEQGVPFALMVAFRMEMGKRTR